MTVTSPSCNESDTVIPGPTRGSTVPSSPRTPGKEVSPASNSGSPVRSKSSSGPSGIPRSQSPVYEQWTDVVGRRNKGTGTSDHPELLLPPGWEEAMADLAKEEEEVELSVTVTDAGSGISRDEVETIKGKTQKS